MCEQNLALNELRNKDIKNDIKCNQTTTTIDLSRFGLPICIISITRDDELRYNDNESNGIKAQEKMQFMLENIDVYLQLPHANQAASITREYIVECIDEITASLESRRGQP